MKKRILELIHKFGTISVKQITTILGISPQYVHRVLKSLMEQGTVKKLGTPPKTYYQLTNDESISDLIEIDQKKMVFLDQYFMQVTEYGERLSGLEAFRYWCDNRNLPLEKTLMEYELTHKKYEKYRIKPGLISGLQKLENTKGFSQNHLDEIYYGDFYAIERFGKTKLGQLMHYGKMAQSIELMNEIVEKINPLIDEIIKRHQINAVGFVPPTISRKIQIMDQLKMKLNINLPHIQIEKLKGPIPIPQKSFSKIHQRIANAQKSMVVTDHRHFNNVLLIDDAVGSGATLHEIAGKYKRINRQAEVIGFAVTGFYKGFEVISEV